jgi:uncharacterized membrane protein
MSLVAVLIALCCQMLIVVGQLFLKHAMNTAGAERADTAELRAAKRKAMRDFALGVGCMACWFFLWLGLLNRYDISKLFVFEGLNPALMATAAWLILKERMSVNAWIGLILVCVGITIVSSS